MPLDFNNIAHAYGSEKVLTDISLSAADGEILCLLGASGSGKTTLLRLAAGLEALQAGTITLNGNVLSQPGRDVRTEDRKIGMVFQDHALFPHLSIAENVAFGLPRVTSDRHEIVERTLADVGLEGLGERYPHTLSGGQQQRVALARALAPAPSVILLDEPFASIDVTRRRQLREHARLALKQSGAITIMVTHDPDEALDMADKIAVMDDGHILQCGEPIELYNAPATALVASLFGDAQTFRAKISGAEALFDYGTYPVGSSAIGLADGNVADLVVRPSSVTLTPTSEGDGLHVLDTRFRGSHWLVLVGTSNANDAPLRVHMADASAFEEGTPVRAYFEGAGIFLFPAAN
ncbi:MAG: ABC transporter ATP-binding protein [Rhodobiaceae bacterium]|nr:ABC transporter ATP-binding protein [Rhodobiaceae bacterium]